jgi:2-hydroxycyclohexanecarboxyl-CoA dehydrogenase
MRLEGKTALVTGGASGIGAATARRLAAEGARVAIGDLDVEGARGVAAELDGFACRLDVTDTGSARAGVAAAVGALGEIDVLVNNAGTDRFSYFVNSDEELWDFVLGVNLRGVLAVTHAVLPRMQERRTGAIVNVASEAGRVGSQGSIVYSAAKAGVIGFTKAIDRCTQPPQYNRTCSQFSTRRRALRIGGIRSAASSTRSGRPLPPRAIVRSSVSTATRTSRAFASRAALN